LELGVVGTGYVGLVTAVGFASKGHRVACVDCDHAKVEQISEGKSPLYEVNIEEMLSKCISDKGSLRATTDYNEIFKSDIVFICVPTPCNSENDIDLTHIVDSATQIGMLLSKIDTYPVVVVKSTVVPGTTEEIIIPALERHSSKKAGKDFGIAVNPEFLQEGKAMECFINPARIVIGEHDRRAGDILEELYRDFRCPIVRTNLRTAEMIKYASNAFLATKISFINEIGNLCKSLEIDVYEVAKGMGYDPRIGNQFLNAGIGFGGGCLPKDLEALIFRARELGYKAELLESVSKLNRGQPSKLVDLASKRLDTLENKIVAVLGLSFKANTDDIRGAPGLKVIADLLRHGAIVRVYDPKAMPNAEEVLSANVEFCNSVPDAIAGSDCVIITTDWDEFKHENLYGGKLVTDGRRTLDPRKARQLCQYEGVCW